MNMRLFVSLALSAITLGITTACQTQTTQPANNPGLQLGVWGGEHIAITVTDKGGTIEYDCAHGTIDQPIVPDSAGHFEVTGTHTTEGGPSRAASTQAENGMPARYSGDVKGNTVTLTVTLTGQNMVVGTFTATLGKAPVIVKCL